MKALRGVVELVLASLRTLFIKKCFLFVVFFTREQVRDAGSQSGRRRSSEQREILISRSLKSMSAECDMCADYLPSECVHGMSTAASFVR